MEAYLDQYYPQVNSLYCQAKKGVQYADDKFHEVIDKINALNPLARMAAYLLLGVAVTLTVGLVVKVVAFTIGATLLVAVVAFRLLLGEEAATIIAEFEDAESDEKIDNSIFLLGCVIAPIIEEILFRAIMQPVIKLGVYYYQWTLNVEEKTARKVAKVVSVVFTAGVFGYAHFSNHKYWYHGLPQVSICTAGGLYYGYLREETGSLWPSIGGHMAWNTGCSTGLVLPFFLPTILVEKVALYLLLGEIV